MMNKPGRREAIGLILAGALAPAMFSRAALAAPAVTLIEPPAGEMIFRRIIRREANGQPIITVARQFAVQFRRFSGGFIVEGRQVSVDVDAAEGLARFAELERNRVESGVFPLALDGFGQILSEGAPQRRGDEIDQALATARARIAAQPLAPGERDELDAFLATLNLAASEIVAVMPADLFAPAEEARIDERSLTLPDGDIGRIINRFVADRNPRTGLMLEAQRNITTEFADTERLTSERWQLVES